MRQVQDKNYFLNKLLKDREINQLLEGQSKKNISGFIDNLKEIKQILHIKEQTDKKILEEYNKLIVIPSGSEETLIRELNQFNKAMYDWPDYYTLDFGVKTANPKNNNVHGNKAAQKETNLNFNELIAEAKQNLKTSVNKAHEDQIKLLSQLAIEFEQDSVNNAMKLLEPLNNEEGLWTPDNKELENEQHTVLDNNVSDNEEDYYDLDIDDEQYYQKRYGYLDKVNKLDEVEFNADHKWDKNDLNYFEANSASAYLSRINKIDPSQSQNSEEKIFRTKLANLPLEFEGTLDELNILFDENNLPIENKNKNKNLYFDLIDKAVETFNSKNQIKQIENIKPKKIQEIKLPKNILGLSQPYIHESTTNFEPTIENVNEIDNDDIKELSDEELTMVTEIWERDPIDPLRYDDLSDFEKRLMNAPIETKDLKKGEWLDEIHNEIMEKENHILKDSQEIIVESEEEKNEQLNNIKNNLDEGNYGKLNLSKPMAITCARYMKKLNYLKRGFEKSYGSELFKKVREWIAEENVMYENAERNNRIKKLKTKRFKTQKSILQKQRLKEIFKVKK